MSRELTAPELADFMGKLPVSDAAMIAGWLKRGDGVAVYQNNDLSHIEIGHVQFCSFGSAEAQIESDEVPDVMPDFQGMIPNWRYVLVGTYRREQPSG